MPTKPKDVNQDILSLVLQMDTTQNVYEILHRLPLVNNTSNNTTDTLLIVSQILTESGKIYLSRFAQDETTPARRFLYLVIVNNDSNEWVINTRDTDYTVQDVNIPAGKTVILPNVGEEYFMTLEPLGTVTGHVIYIGIGYPSQ